MIGKASEWQLQEIYLDYLDDWRANNPDVEVIEIKFAIHPNGKSVCLIIYKEETE